MTEKIAEAVDGFGKMNARQQTIHQWTVTSWRNDTLTVHQANLLELTCTCKDKQYNRNDEEACAHIMKANHQAHAQMDVGEALNYSLHEQVMELTDVVDYFDQKMTAIKADEALADAGGSAGDGDGGQDLADDDIEEAFLDRIQESPIDVGALSWWIDDDYGSLQAETTDYLDDDEFAAWQELQDDLGMQWDPDEEVSYLKRDDAVEVFG